MLVFKQVKNNTQGNCQPASPKSALNNGKDDTQVNYLGTKQKEYKLTSSQEGL